MSQKPQLTTLPCSSCHTPDHWRPLSASMQFDHDKQTRFPLEGQHKIAECIQCHIGNSVEEMHRFDQVGSDCTVCHMDIHMSTYGLDCQVCHNPDHWEMGAWWRNHDLTLFPLTGAHVSIGCEACHGVNLNRLGVNLTTECNDCHFTNIQQLISAAKHPDNLNCILCHNTLAWIPIDMSQHDFLFPIYTGKHRGTWSTCEAECHLNPMEYTDFSCGLNDICHDHRKSKMDDKHQEESGYEYESQACYGCHPSGEESD